MGPALCSASVTFSLGKYHSHPDPEQNSDLKRQKPRRYGTCPIPTTVPPALAKSEAMQPGGHGVATLNIGMFVVE
jgi:hypothetical protein